jgi:hypothetical protein
LFACRGLGALVVTADNHLSAKLARITSTLRNKRVTFICSVTWIEHDNGRSPHGSGEAIYFTDSAKKICIAYPLLLAGLLAFFVVFYESITVIFLLDD